MYATTSSVLVAALPTLYRQGLLSVLQATWPGLSYSLLTDTATMPALLRRQAFAVIVLDCDLLPDSGTQFLDHLRTIRSAQPVLLLTAPRLSSDLRHYLAQHNCRCQHLPRRTTPAAVIAAIRPFLQNDSTTTTGYLPVATARQASAPPTPFSRRELDVLRLVIADCCNQEIADQLYLSVRTVESHRRALLQKAGAKTLVGLVVQAVREGWVAVA